MVCTKVIILPGNGCANVLSCNWYGWLSTELASKFPTIDVVVRNMPDPYVAKESVWIPFIKNEMGADSSTIVVGHSSGAVCAMRLAETTEIHGLVLVSACHTDLGDENERASGYFSRPWLWESMRKNTQWYVTMEADGASGYYTCVFAEL